MSENFCQWIFDKEKKMYLGSTPKSLESVLSPGYYRFSITRDGEPIATNIDIKRDSLFEFKEEPFLSAIDEIKTFWNKDKSYKDLGMTHKRGILLYGPPGCGKTSLISQFIQDIIERKGIAISISSYGDIEKFLMVVPLFRQIQSETYLVVIIEDIDHLIEDGCEELILEILDGTSAVTDKILYLTTTNKFDDVPDRIKYRPSRIDTLIEIDYPNNKLLNGYIDFVLKKNKNLANTLRTAIKKKKNLTFADMKEIIISNRIYGKTVPESIQKIMKCKSSATGEELRKIEDEDDEE